MPFPTVRNDPWKKGMKPRRQRRLWPDSFWRELVKPGVALDGGIVSPFRGEVLRRISEINTLLYGSP